MERAQEANAILVCAECGEVAAGAAHGWRGYLADGEGARDEVAVFCPGCADREFGPR